MLEESGLQVAAKIEIAPGAFSGTTIEGCVFVIGSAVPNKKLVGVIRDRETADQILSELLRAPAGKEGPNWAGFDRPNQRTFSDVEQERLLQKLKPRGHHEWKPLGSLLTTAEIKKADKPIAAEEGAAVFLFIPEYAGSRVTADLEEQTVKSSAIYRLPVDPAKANPRFIAQLLNSPYGKQLRTSVAMGATIQRTRAPELLALTLPLPDLATQNQLARVKGDIRLLRATLSDLEETLDRDRTTLADETEKVDELKAVFDIERRIADWWRELPYPLAAIYRRYKVSVGPRDRLDTLLHFFEMVAIYLATIGTSHVKALRQDWEEVKAKWLRPAGAVGIERADFGFWINLASVSLKDASRIASEKELRTHAMEIAGPELVQVAGRIGALGKAKEVLDVARSYRNSWIGHGGHMKSSDAKRLDDELQQPIRDLYELTSSLFRRLYLVRPGTAEVTEIGMKFETEILSGSDPTFGKQKIELDRRINTNALAFWMSGARTMCHALPFFRLGAPQQPQETSVYVFNRVVGGKFRWISYQEAREQEVFAPDDELSGIIGIGSRNP